MKGKATAAFVTCLMIFSGLGAFLGAAGPAGPTGGPTMPPARGPTPDNDSEPNDDFTNATLITGSATFDGGVGMGDLDYYKINLNSGSTADTLEVRLTLLVGVTILDIYDPNQFLILRDGTPPQTGSTLKLSFTAFMTGYYYIYLRNMGPCNYSLTTVLGSGPFTTDGDNTPAQALDVEAAGYPYTAGSTINNNTDIQDFYKIHLNYTALISTDVFKAFVQVPATGTFGLQLFSPADHVFPLSPSTEPDFTLMGINQSFTFSPTAGSDFYLRVWAPRGSGAYSLTLNKFSGTADQNDIFAAASAIDKTAPHWYNTTGNLTLGIDQDDYYLIENVVAGQVFNCTVTCQDYDAMDMTPNIRISLYNDTEFQLPPDPTDNLADPVAQANTRLQDPGKFYIQLNLTEWAGSYLLSIYTNSPPQVAGPIANISFSENTDNTTIKLAQVFSDPEGDPLAYSYELFGGIKDHMNVTIGDDADRTVTLHPDPGWRGTGSMSWDAADPSNETAEAIVESIAVTGINHRPELINSSIQPLTLLKNKPDQTSLNMLNIFSDPDDGDKLKYNVTGNVHIRVSFPLDPVNNYWPTGEVILVPDMDWTGVEVLGFTALDNGVPPMSSLQVNITVEVIELFVEKVTGRSPPKLNMTEDIPDGSLNMLDYFNSTAPGDAFTVVYLPLAGSHLNVTLAINGKLTIVPQDEWSGIETLRFRGTCQHNFTVNITLTVEVAPVNDAVIITSFSPSQASQTISEGDSVRFNISVFDEETPLTQLKLKWTLDGTNVSSLAEYNFTTGFDTVAGQPSKTFSVKVTVNDGLTSAFQNWTVTVNNVNQPPRDARITFPPDGQAFDEGAKVHLIGIAVDLDGDSLTYQWFEGTKLLGSGIEFNTTKLGAGKHNITLKVSDASSSASASITIKVNAKKSPGFEALAVVAVAVVAALLIAVARRKK